MQAAVDPATLPPQRRQACQRCFKRKQKCDKLLPACSNCSDLGIKCEPRRWAFNASSSIPKETGITNASLAEYVCTLKGNIGKLENGNSRAPLSKRRRTDAVSSAGPSPSSEPGPEDDPSGTELPNRDVSVRDTMGDIGYLSRSAMAEPRGYEDKFPRNLTLDNMIIGALALNGIDPARAVASPPSRLGFAINGQSGQSPMRLDRDGTIGFIRAFIDHVCVQYPHLRASIVMEQYELVVTGNLGSTPQSIENDASQSTALPLFNTYLSIAMGAMLSPDPGVLSASLVARLHAVAVEQLPWIAKTSDALAMVRCLLGLAIFAMSNTHGGSVWHLVGLTMKKCISSGLHKEPDNMAELSSSELNERRELFWSTYILDRSISGVLGRPFGIPDEDITIHLPDIDDTSPTSVEDTYKHHLIAQARLASNIRSKAREAPTYDYRNLCFWREPPSNVVSLAKMHRPISEHLEQLACRTLIQIIRPVSTPHDYHNLLTMGGQSLGGGGRYNTHAELEADTVSSCRLFIDRCYDQSNQGRGFLGSSFLDAYDIFYAGIVFIYLTRLRANSITMDQPKAGEDDFGAQVSEVIQKCSMLVTILSQQFSALRVFQRTLLVISTRMMTVGPRTPYDNKVRGIPDELRSMVSERILRLIETCP